MKSNVIPMPDRGLVDIRRIAGDVTIEQLQRAHLAVEAQLERPRLSTLIALLANATPAEREILIRQIEARK